MHDQSVASSGGLSGVRVLDFSRVLAGPYASMTLGDLGADVIKIESPRGDDTRSWLPPTDPQGLSTYFAAVNRNKRSVALDLSGPEGETARRLAETADVIIENFRPGTMARFGLSYEDVSRINPRIVYCSISGFGEGAGAELRGYDLLVQATGGLMSVTGTPEGAPTKAGTAVIDVIAGLQSATGVLAALHERERSGRGQRITIDLLSTGLAALANQSSAALLAEVVPGRLGNRHPSIAPYEDFPTAEGTLVIAVGNDSQFRALATTLGRPELADDPEFQTNELRVSHRARLVAELTEAMSSAGAEEWTERLTANGVPAGPVRTVPDAIRFADSLGLAPVQTLQDTGTKTIASPIRLSRTPVTYRTAPPRAPGTDPHIEWTTAPMAQKA